MISAATSRGWGYIQSDLFSKTMAKKPFCGNPLCEHYRVDPTMFLDAHTIKAHRSGGSGLLKRTTYRLVSDEGSTIFQEDLCDTCGNVIDMIDPERDLK